MTRHSPDSEYSRPRNIRGHLGVGGRGQKISAPMPEGQRLLRVGEVAEVMRVSTMTVYRLIKSGDLAATRVGRSWRIWEGDVMAYLERSKG